MAIPKMLIPGLIFLVLAALMALVGFGTASGMADLARILFAAFGALCFISLALSLGSWLGGRTRT